MISRESRRQVDTLASRGRPTHPDEVRRVYERVLTGSSVRSRHVTAGDGRQVHLLEKGAGPPVVLLHGTGNAAGFLLPLLDELEGVHALALDLPGMGLSDPIDAPRNRYRETAVAWLDNLLDVLALETTTLVGHSGGAVRAFWYAHAHPERVGRLVLIGPPAFPDTRCPLPIRLMGTAGVGELLSRLAPPSPRSMMKLADFMGEKETLAAHPELIDLLVAVGRDPAAGRATMAEERVLVSPFALLSPSGFRRRSRVRPEELRELAMPTLVIWGERDPLGGVSVARAFTDLVPQARLLTLPTGHGPWLGLPERTAGAIVDFAR